MSTICILGLGYTAGEIAAGLRARGWQVEATGRAGTVDFADAERLSWLLARCDAVLSSVPPVAGAGAAEDPALAAYGADLAALRARGGWLGYLSSTGVYGHCAGAWVDETAPVASGRRHARMAADAGWLAAGAHVFRLPGIYGPDRPGEAPRNMFARLEQGRAHRVAAPDQLFSRVHVADIASGVIAALERQAPPGAYNLADDAPCHPDLVVQEACRLSGWPLPPRLAPDDPALSAKVRGFYGESRKVANGKAKRLLGWRPRYPSWREGLAAIWAGRSAAGDRR
ncbi:MAG TPA: SDR family NAD(P)-dependent oxidoreductase [Novosphingobium sp.]|nr:SDR family NAD(P)-dependent oxidoreductase [Novosphingobium sp.]